MDLQNKVALITGASSGIGKAIATAPQYGAYNGTKYAIEAFNPQPLSRFPMIKARLPAIALARLLSLPVDELREEPESAVLAELVQQLTLDGC